MKGELHPTKNQLLVRQSGGGHEAPQAVYLVIALSLLLIQHLVQKMQVVCSPKRPCRSTGLQKMAGGPGKRGDWDSHLSP